MGFSAEIIKKAWDRSAGQCECNRNYHDHSNKENCESELIWEKRNCTGEKGAWFAHHKVSKVNGGSEEDLENCEILCHECHKSAAWYGIF